MRLRRFTFLDPGPLRDGELSLVAPDGLLVGAVLAAAHHPLTVERDPELAHANEQQVTDFLAAAPGGCQPTGAMGSLVPVQHFWMLVGQAEGVERRVAGMISLRIGENDQLRLYYGHVGYHVYPVDRGRNYAERACRLLLPLAGAYGLRELWITASPDNTASRRTCERLGATLVDTVELPQGHHLYERGQRYKCRYWLAV